MTLAWPEGPWRRTDVVVGTAYVLVGLSTIAQRVVTTGHFQGQTGAIAFLVVTAAFELLCTVPGLGVIKGIRLGFVLTAILAGLGFLGAMLQWLLIAKQPSAWYPVMAGYNLFVGGYCAFRLRGMTDSEVGDAKNSEPLPPSSRPLDVMAGALNVLPVIWLAAAISSQSTAGFRSESSDSGLNLTLGGLVLIHLLLCLGLVFSRRSAFIAMVLWLGFVLYGELQLMQFSRVRTPLGLVLVAVLQGATLAYCVVRSRKAKPLAGPP